MQELLPLDSLVYALKRIVPDAEWLLGEIESNNGTLRLPRFVQNALKNPAVARYPELYENERAIWYCFARAFLTHDQIADASKELEAASLVERGSDFCDILEMVGTGVDGLKIPKTPEDEARQLKVFESLSAEDQKAAIQQSVLLYSALFAAFHQSMAVMVVGEKLTSLVAQAKTGLDEPFLKAIRIDYRILETVPYFRERYQQARAEGGDFLRQIHLRQAKAPYVGRIRRRALWLTFTFLDMAGLLDSVPRKNLLIACDEIGIGGSSGGISSVETLNKRIADFRRFQNTGIVSTP